MYRSLSSELHWWIWRHTPSKRAVVTLNQPPIFSGHPERKRILSPLYHPPETEYSVSSRTIPGLNWSFCSGMAVRIRRFELRQQRLQPAPVGTGHETRLPLAHDLL